MSEHPNLSTIRDLTERVNERLGITASVDTVRAVFHAQPGPWLYERIDAAMLERIERDVWEAETGGQAWPFWDGSAALAALKVRA